MEDRFIVISNHCLTKENREDELRKQKEYERNHYDEIEANKELGIFTGNVIRNLFGI